LPEEVRVAPDSYAKAKEAIGYIGGVFAIFKINYSA